MNPNPFTRCNYIGGPKPFSYFSVLIYKIKSHSVYFMIYFFPRLFEAALYV